MTAAHLADAALSDLIDRETEQTYASESHLATCEYCRRRLDGMRTTVQYVQAAVIRIRDADVPAELWVMIAARTIHALPPGRFWRTGWRLAWALLLATILAVIVFHVAFPRGFKTMREQSR